jgi:hypothetical protein
MASGRKRDFVHLYWQSQAKRLTEMSPSFAPHISACRLSSRRFAKFVLEFEVNKKLPLETCRQAFRY